MNPLDLVPKWVWMALVATFAATSCKLKIDNSGMSLEIEKGKTHVAELQTSIARANAQSAAQTAQWEKQAREAAQSALKRQQALVADASRAQSELDGLRHALSTSRSQWRLDAPNTPTTGFDYTDTLSDLLGQCSSRVVDLARAADGHAFDALTLRESWPR